MDIFIHTACEIKKNIFISLIYERRAIKLYSVEYISATESIYYELNEKREKISFDPRVLRGDALLPNE